jgi:hypothetical protein
MRWLRRWFADTYLTVDPRSAGVFRIGLSLVLCWDLLRRLQHLDVFYTNAGLLPNHTLLWRPPTPHMFSLFFLASTHAEALLLFALCGCCYAMLLVGYRTRLAQLLSLICRVSLNSRLAVLENGGDMVMNVLCVLSLALPLGRRFSIDALRAPEAEREQPIVSVAMLGLIVQFAFIYFFNASAKDGDAWRRGDAVYYALNQDKYVTGLGLWMREHLPLEAFHWLSWGTLLIEWTGFVLIITPLLVDQARALAIVLMPSLHLCFALGLHLGSFSIAMMSFYPLLLRPAHWRALERWRGRQPRAARASTALPPSAAGHWRRFAREAACGLVIFAIASEALNDNGSVPAWLRVPQPGWAKAIVEYPRLLQGWRMFAPNPPQWDVMIYVDATTARGARVDPYNELASRQHFPAGDFVPRRMDQSQFFSMYSDRIGLPNYAVYRQALLEWLVAYPERTGRAEDCLVAFDVYYLAEPTPAPGAPRSGSPERSRFLSYSAPPDGSCKPLQPKPDVQSLQARDDAR